jgi:hypothetical protein
VLTIALLERHMAVVQLLLNKDAAVSADTLLYAARAADAQGVLLVVAALGPAADTRMLRLACKAAFASHAVAVNADAAVRRLENVAVLLKQLCLVDPAAVEGVVSGLQQPEVAAAACVARWLAETRSIVEQQQQQLDEQQRTVVAERLAAQQLVVAAAGTQRRAAAEQQALEQRVDDVAGAEQRSGSGPGVAAWEGLLLPVLQR